MDEQFNSNLEILLLEDNLGDIELTMEIFQEGQLCSHLSVVTDGEAALAFLRRKGKYANAPRPDLILLDLNLPKVTGREVLAEIKADPDLRRIPAIVLTTSDAETDILKCYDLHANCYIRKPVNLDQFIQVIKAIEYFWFAIVKLPPK